MNLGQMFAAELEHEAISTRKMLERIPDDFDWSPHEKSMTIGSLASHVALIPIYVKATLTGDSLDLDASGFTPPVMTNASGLTAAFDAGLKEALDLLSAASNDDLEKTWRLTKGEHVIFDLPRAAVLRSMVLSHLFHHRGQLSVYLRLKNIPVPSIYGPSADEQT